MTKPIRLLLAEDEAIPALLLERKFLSFGWSVANHVSTGEDAIRRARELSPDLIVMDIGLAGRIDGIEAAAIIKSEREVPVLFVTSYEDRATIERAQRLSPLGYLTKPVDMRMLKSIVEAYFEAM